MKYRDLDFFDCSKAYELNYVAHLYGVNWYGVLQWLKKQCANGRIKYLRHFEVHEMIERELKVYRLD